jgi:hypothetical protein
LCTSALVVLASLVMAAPRAAAQAGSPSLLPLPAVTASDVVTASYNLPPTNTGPQGSMFVGQDAGAPAETGEAAGGSVIDGADGHSQFQESLYNEWTDCDQCAPGGRWFGAMGALVMGRNRANPYWTTYETNNNANQLLNTQNAGVDWTGGWQISAGYMFGACSGCGCCGPCGPCGGCGGCGASGPGLGITYWGLGQMRGFAQINSPTDELSTPINLLDPTTGSGEVEIGGDPASDFFDNSASHRIFRNDRVNNFELNLLFGAFNVGRWTVVPFAGFRYFRFDERLTFGGLAGGATWGGNGGADEAYLSFRTVNNLYGGQLGTYANYMFSDRFGLFIGPKVGVFGNQMNDRTLLYRGDGVTAYDIAAHKADFSLLGELDTGLTWFVGPRFMAYLGYRVVGVTNVALGDNQFLPYLADVDGFAQVKQSGSLILHGAMIGGGWMF